MGSIATRMARQQIGGGHPSLDLNFVAGAWPSGLSFSRASGATVTCWARYGDNLVTNGGPFTATTGWSSLSGVNLAAVSNSLQLTSTATNGGGQFTSLTLKNGAMYRVQMTNTGATSVNVYLSHGIDFYFPLAAGASFSGVFVCQGTSGLLKVFTSGASGTVAAIGSASVQELTLWKPGMDWLGPELVTTPNIDSVAQGGSAFTNYSTGANVVAGRTYQLRGTVTNYAGSNSVGFGWAGSPPLMETGDGNGVIGGISVPTYSGGVAVFSRSLNSCSFRNISVREQLYTLQTVLVPANVPRIAYDPATGACLGAMVEPQRTNLILGSGAIDVAPWLGSGVTASSGAPAPDGSLTGTTLNASSTFNSWRTPVINVTASTTYTLSFWAKRGTATDAKYSVGNVSAGGDVVAATSFYSQINGASWARVSLTFTVPVGCTQIYVFVLRDSGVTGTLLVWGAQLEQAAEMSSYIPTAGAAATRAADDLRAASIGFFNNSLGTWVVDFHRQQRPPLPNIYSRLVGINTGQAYLGLDPGSGKVFTFDGTTVRTTLNGMTAAVTNKAAVSWTGSAKRLCLNAGEVDFQTVAMPAATTIGFGINPGSIYTDWLNGHIQRLRYYPRAMTPAEIRAVTK